VPQWRSDIIVIDIPESVYAAAKEVASQVVDNFYNRCGYSKKERINKISDGYIGEWAFKQFINGNLKDMQDTFDLDKINPIFGKSYSDDGPDDGWDVSFGGDDLTIDVKTYLMRDRDEPAAISYIYNNLNLLINKDQYDHNKGHADIYVQVFYTANPRKAYISGYSKGIPGKNKHFQQESYYERVSNLNPVMNIFSIEIPKMLMKC